MSWMWAVDRRLFRPMERLFYPYCRRCRTINKLHWARAKLGGGPFHKCDQCGEELVIPPHTGWHGTWRLPLFLLYLLARLAYWWVCFLLVVSIVVPVLLIGLLIRAMRPRDP